MDLSDLTGHDLGTHDHHFTADDAILYALAVGAAATDLDLIFERDLRVLPTYACAIGLWAVEKTGELGAYDRTKSLHVGQTLQMKDTLEPGFVSMTAAVRAVYDKGRMTIVEIDVTSRQFDARYTIFLPGVGEWGGPPPPTVERLPVLEPQWTRTEPVASTAAALYRLTGDKHPVHIDSLTATAMGLEAPILHGLATLGIVARASALASGVHPADLVRADVRLSAPVYPGSSLIISGAAIGDAVELQIEAATIDSVAMSGTFAFETGQPTTS